jgi:hypothetical protein
MPICHWRRLFPSMVGLLVALMILTACDFEAVGIIPTPCPGNCPPPERSNANPKTYMATHFRLTYFDPWTIASSDAQHVILVAQTDLGQISAEVASTTITPGTTAQQLLTRKTQQVLDPNQYANVQDAGPILGAEIGYIAGAGEAYQADVTDPNAPASSVYFEVMASVRGNTGLTFVALSPLDPSSQDTSVVPDQSYDLLVNSVEWI